MATIFAPGLFRDQVALITGGGSGIGLAIAHALGELGARVAIAGRDGTKLAKAAAELQLAGIEVLPQLCDIREEDQVMTLVDEVLAKWGRVDILVNNAGGQFPSPAEKLSTKGWKAVVETNLNGTFVVTRTVAEKAMLPAGSGRIVSIVANMWRGFPSMAHTGAARAGVVNLTQTLAVEWASRGIRVNAVAPGVVLSSGTERYPPELIERAVAATPLKRAGNVAEVAQAVVYMCSPAADWITGETLCIDGGARLWGDVWQIP
jgi:citronellol/citronellal dehydrogenase